MAIFTAQAGIITNIFCRRTASTKNPKKKATKWWPEMGGEGRNKLN